MIRRLLALAVIGAVALSIVASASGSAGPRARSAASWTVKVTAPGHKPKARKRWPVKIVAKTSSGNWRIDRSSMPPSPRSGNGCVSGHAAIRG